MHSMGTNAKLTINELNNKASELRNVKQSSKGILLITGCDGG